MAIAYCNFIRLKIPGGSYTAYAYQNFFINEAKVYNSASYNYLPFIITSGAGRKGGDRSNSSLVLTPNAISINVLAEAAESYYLLEVNTVEVDALTLSLLQLITQDLWVINRMEFDTEKVILQLASPLDAVDGQVPRRYLSNVLVGSLPTSGRLALS